MTTDVTLGLAGLVCERQARIATVQQPGTAELRLTDADHVVVISPGGLVDEHTLASAEALLTAVTAFVDQLRLHDQPGRYVAVSDQS
jgi:hypothetical protein